VTLPREIRMVYFDCNESMSMREGLMRQIEYRKRHSLKYRRKLISIRELADDKECSTKVQKSFIYKIKNLEYTKTVDSCPQIFIRKHIDNRRQIEYFHFKVKGSFSLKQGRCSYVVEFCHILKINIYWKDKIFSPKKSGTLT